MPNWVSNQLTAIGSKEEVAHFAERAKGKDSVFDFHSFVPMPDALRNTEEVHYPDTERKEKQEAIYATNKALYGFASWYDWACEKWGTKWNASDAVVLHEDDSGISYDFQTAWDAPLPVIVEMSKQFPNLRFILQSDEESQSFFYEKEFVAGKQTKHEDLEREE
jgi:hypothetical protein